MTLISKATEIFLDGPRQKWIVIHLLKMKNCESQDAGVVFQMFLSQKLVVNILLKVKI